MVYEPQTKKGIYDGEKGTAQVTISKNGAKVRAVMDEPKDISIEKRTYIVDRSECPNVLVSGHMNIRLSTDGDIMFSAYPASGLFAGKVTEFTSREDEPPLPKTNQKWQYLYFTALLEIVDPQSFRGMTVPLTLRYNFGEVEENGHAVVGYTNPKSKYSAILQEFMKFTGAWNAGPIKWSDNILPVLEKRIQKEGRTFQFVIKNGWIESLIEHVGTQAAETIPWEEDDSEPVEEKAEFDKTEIDNLEF